MRKLAAVTLLALLLTLAAHAQLAVPGGDFESGTTGWDLQGKATISKDKPAGGKAALALQSDGATAAWACSPALTGLQPGSRVNLSFALRRPQGQAALGLSIVGTPAELTDSFIWQALPPKDQAWHTVSLTLVLPPLPGGAPPRLGFVVPGPAGTWQLDNLTLQAEASQPAPPLVLTGETPETPVLPEQWQPEGTLDARVKQIGSENELMLNVNGIELGVRPELRCRRGHRAGLMVLAVNRGHIEKDLQVTVTAPAGVDAPGWVVPIKPEGTTTFHTVIQSLRQGEFWVKLTFTSAGQQASVPVKIITQAAYPLIGTIWRDRVNVEQLDGLQALPVDLHLLAGAPDLGALGPMAKELQTRGLEYMAAPDAGSLNTSQYLEALTRLCSGLRPSYWIPYSAGDSAAAGNVAPQFITALRKQDLPASVFSSPLTVAPDWSKAALLPLKANLINRERLAGVAAAVSRLPVLAPACVVAEKLDGKADAVGGASVNWVRQVDLTALALLLRERDLRIPALVDELRAASTGDERLDALHFARVMTKCFYHANTGLILPVERKAGQAFGLHPLTDDSGKLRPLATVIRTLSLELAGATPLAPLADTPEASLDQPTPITYHPFQRGGEGIVVLWNNTSTPQDVSLEFRGEPVSAYRLLLNQSGELAVRRWDPIMKFSADAFKRNEPAVYLRLDPLQVQVHSFRLRSPGFDWLRSVSLTRPFVAPKDDSFTGRANRSWWTDMLRQGKKID